MEDKGKAKFRKVVKPYKSTARRPAVSPDKARSFRKDRTRGKPELGAITSAINESSKQIGQLFATYLVIGTYIAISTTSTTDEQLLRGSNLPVPLLNGTLPLMVFYAFIPLIFVIVHLHLLLHNQMLLQQIRDFHRVINKYPWLERQYVATKQRALLHPVFLTRVYYKLGRRDSVRIVFSVIKWFTFMSLPVALLILVQCRFLPYHSLGMTWWHRLLIFADVVIPAFFTGGNTKLLNEFEEELFDVPKERSDQVEKITSVAPENGRNDITEVVPQGDKVIPPKPSWLSNLWSRVYRWSQRKQVIVPSLLWRSLGGRERPYKEMGYWRSMFTRTAQRHEKQPRWMVFRQTLRFSLIVVGLIITLSVATLPDEVQASTYLRNIPWWSGMFRNFLSLDNKDLYASISEEEVAAMMSRGSSRAQAVAALAKGLNLRGRDLRYAHFSNCDLTNANLSYADMRGAKLENCVLTNVQHVGTRGYAEGIISTAPGG